MCEWCGGAGAASDAGGWEEPSGAPPGGGVRGVRGQGLESRSHEPAGAESGVRVGS